MTVLLTGASGFVGRHFAARVDCMPLEKAGKEVDIVDREAVFEIVESVRPQTVVHLAALTSVPESFANPLETYKVNFLGTLNLLSGLREIGFNGRMLFVGTSDAYGQVADEKLPVVESQPLRPRSPYAVSKVAAEALCYQWSQTEEFDIVMARPFNHIGPGQDERFAIASFARQICGAGESPGTVAVGDIDVSRDFTDVRDVVDAYLELLSRGENGCIYNVCSQEERSLRSLLELLIARSGESVEIREDTARLRPSEQRRMVGCADRIGKVTGWTPKIPIEETLDAILDHWQTMPGKDTHG